MAGFFATVKDRKRIFIDHPAHCLYQMDSVLTYTAHLVGW